MATLFKAEFRTDVLGRGRPGTSRDKPLGLLGGVEKVRSALGEATKQDELLKKTLVKKSWKQKGGARRGAGSRSRSRSPVSARKSKHIYRYKSSNGRRGRNNKTSKSGGAGSSTKNRDESEDSSKDYTKSSCKGKGKGKGKKSENTKGEYLSPSCLSDAWPSFFSSTAIMMVTAIGLAVDMVPRLDKLPLAGRIGTFIDDWRKVCSNSWVLRVVEFGYQIPLKFIPQQSSVPINPSVSKEAHKVLLDEANDLKRKGAVSVVDHLPGEYISSYFAVPKARSPGKFRPILNLKYFNKNVKKYKFKMETLASVREWIREGSYCTGLDLKDAFPHIKIHELSKKFLRFAWLGELLQWEVLPFGLTCSPRVLTKVLKPIIAFLRATWAILISIYMDDMLIQADSVSQVMLHTHLVMLVMMCLGWSFNWEKSMLNPSQTVTHLGFVFDTVAMTISLPAAKLERLVSRCRTHLQNGFISVHDLERLLGTMESVRPCTPLAALHYRYLQKQLIIAKRFGRQPRKKIILSAKSIFNLQWWVSQNGFSGSCSSPIRERKPNLDIWSDANLSMGGARNSRGEFFQRAWSNLELSSNPSINLLELRAAREGLKNLALPGDHVRLHLDNITACSYIKKQGGTRNYRLSREACLLWKESLERGVSLLDPQWLSTKDNVEADFLSRNDIHYWEIVLEKSVFRMILETFQVQPTLDAFASKETAQLSRYMSWFKDDHALAMDAFLHDWDPVTYLFPPVPLIMKVLQKVRSQGIHAVLVCPQWPTALWWPMVVEMLVDPPIPLPHYKEALKMMSQGVKLPYMEPLVAVHISGLRMK